MTIRNIAISCRQQFFLISTCPFRYTFLLFFSPSHSFLIVVTFTLFLLFPFSTSCTHVRSFPCQPPFHHTFTSSAFIFSFSKNDRTGVRGIWKICSKSETMLRDVTPPHLNTLKYVGNSIKLEERDEKKNYKQNLKQLR